MFVSKKPTYIETNPNIFLFTHLKKTIALFFLPLILASAHPSNAQSPSAEITWPTSGQIVGGTVVVEGSVSGAYSLYVSPTENISDGTLIWSSETAITNDALGFFDTDELSQGTHYIITDINNEQYSSAFIVDNNALESWITPSTQSFKAFDSIIQSVDIGITPGEESFSIEQNNGNYSLRIFTATGIPFGNASFIQLTPENLVHMLPPVVGEVSDNYNNTREIVTAVRYLNENSEHEVKITVHDYFGIPTQSRTIKNISTPIDSRYDQNKLALGDINNDGKDEIIFVDNGTLRIFNGELTPLLEVQTSHLTPGTLAIAEIDDIPGEDIVISSHEQTNSSQLPWQKQFNSSIQALNLSGIIWETQFTSKLIDDLVITDLDLDGDSDVIAVRKDQNEYGQASIELLNKNGEAVTSGNWPISFSNIVNSISFAPYLSPIDNAMRLALVTQYLPPMPSQEHATYGLTVVDRTGSSTLSSSINEAINLNLGYNRVINKRLLVANLNNDTDMELFVSAKQNGTQTPYIQTFSEDGTPVEGGKFQDKLYWQDGIFTHQLSPTPIIADVNHDGYLDISAVSAKNSDIGYYWQSTNLQLNQENIVWGSQLGGAKNKNNFIPPVPTSNFPSVFLRASNNGFTPQEMTLVADNTWEITTIFQGRPTHRFKFDVYGDWAVNYGDDNLDGIGDEHGDDIYIQHGGDEYVIQFNDETLVYTMRGTGTLTEEHFDFGPDLVIKLGESIPLFESNLISSPEGSDFEWIYSDDIRPNKPGRYIFASYWDYKKPDLIRTDKIVDVINSGPNSFDQVYFRGTPNQWGTTAMTMVYPDVWEIAVEFSETTSNPRFKFDIHGDWSLNYGDKNYDGVLDRKGTDIPVDKTGTVYIRFFEDDLHYEVSHQSYSRIDGSKHHFKFFPHNSNDLLIFGYHSSFSNRYGYNYSAEQLTGPGDLSYDWPGGTNYPFYGMSASLPGKYSALITGTSDTGPTVTKEMHYEFVAANAQVQFICGNVTPGEGQAVYVVGNHPTLGNWRPTRSNRMTHYKNGTHVKMRYELPQHTDIEWKCVIADTYSLDIVRWESGNNNKTRTRGIGLIQTTRSNF